MVGLMTVVVGADCRKDGVEAAYRNDQRQEFVNNLAYKHGTGLGTAPWYGVPGTAYDFSHAKPAAPTYHTDASRPTGYGYDSSLAQYHSQPSPHAGGYKSGKCDSQDERYDSQPAKDNAKYPRVEKAAIPVEYRPFVVGSPVDGGYSVAIQKKGYGAGQTAYAGSADRSKVGYDGLTGPAGYMSGTYESVGYGYMY